jgi:H+-transporting ATPase
MAPPNGDIENGDVEKESRTMNPDVNNDDNDMGEYGNLVKYISNYRDGRRASIGGGSSLADIDDKPKKWWQFGKKSSGADGSFDTPEEWLQTDWKKGLSTAEVEARRKKTGFNELTTEKENLFLKFLSYFTGPILYGKLSLQLTRFDDIQLIIFAQLWKLLSSSRLVCVTGLISV